MNSLIIGASGFLGSYLLKESQKLGNGYGTAFADTKENLLILDIRNSTSVKILINKINPDIIFIPAALTHVDYCEEHPKEAAEINVTGIKNIVNTLNDKKKRYKLVFFSTSYVFDGVKGSYKETSVAKPINEYGKQKLKAERYIQKNVKDYLIIRTTEIYGWEKNNKNFVAKLILDSREGKKRKIPNNLIGSPTYVVNLVEIIYDLLKKNERGIINIVGKDNIDRYSFAKRVANVFKLNQSLLEPFDITTITVKAKRPLNSGLSLDKLQSRTIIPIDGIKEGLAAMKKTENML